MTPYRLLLCALFSIACWSMIAAAAMEKWSALGLCVALAVCSLAALMWEGIKDNAG